MRISTLSLAILSLVLQCAAIGAPAFTVTYYTKVNDSYEEIQRDVLKSRKPNAASDISFSVSGQDLPRLRNSRLVDAVSIEVAENSPRKQGAPWSFVIEGDHMFREDESGSWMETVSMDGWAAAKRSEPAPYDSLWLWKTDEELKGEIVIKNIYFLHQYLLKGGEPPSEKASNEIRRYNKNAETDSER